MCKYRIISGSVITKENIGQDLEFDKLVYDVIGIAVALNKLDVTIAEI